MQNNLNCVSDDFLYTMQILTQNSQISRSTRNRLLNLYKDSLSNEENREALIKGLRKVSYKVDIDFLLPIDELIKKLQ